MGSFLIATCFTERQFPPPQGPEIALAGRSNVGKSTFINGLVRKPLARVSGTPGKTRSVNFYWVNFGKGFTLVDLPGFGFASRSHSERASWARLIEEFITRRESLALLVHLVDSMVSWKSQKYQEGLRITGFPSRWSLPR